MMMNRYDKDLLQIYFMNKIMIFFFFIYDYSIPHIKDVILNEYYCEKV